MLRVHLIPALGQKRLDEITNEDVQSLKHRLRDKSPKAVNNVLTVLNRLLKTAADWEVLDRMPCAIRLLKSSTGSVDFFDFADSTDLLKVQRRWTGRAHLIVLLAGHAGLRSGEIRALAWSDVNLDKRQLRVERADWRGHISTTKGGKTRYVPLTNALTEALRTHRHLRGPVSAPP